MSAKHEYQFKILLIGDSGVGKTSLLMRFADNKFSENYISTIGVDFRFCIVKVDAYVVKLQIWDTAGQERFKSVTSAYYRGADAIIMVYDVSDQNSFIHLQDWLDEINRHAPDNVKSKIIVSNKNDRPDKIVNSSEAQVFAKSNGFQFVETSVKDNNHNIESLFLTQTQTLLRQKLAASIVSNERPLTSDFLTCTRFPLSFSEYRAKADQNEKCCV